MRKDKIAFLLLFIIAGAFFSGLAEADGTITAVFKIRDAAGIETPLAHAYIYLRPDSEEDPKEIYFRPATYILGPSDANGRISASVPDGLYHVRITRRNPLDPADRPFGPPEPSDYTWKQTDPVTISTGNVTDLGTRYATTFGTVIPSGTMISGTVSFYTGGPAAYEYVRAQGTRCIFGNHSNPDPAYWIDSNRCGPDKYAAFGRTDANGKYLIYLRNPGTYYIYGSTCLGDRHHEGSQNPCAGRPGTAVTVRAGEKKTVDFWIYNR